MRPLRPGDLRGETTSARRRDVVLGGALLLALAALGSARAAPVLRLEADVPLIQVGHEVRVNLHAVGVTSFFGASLKVKFDGGKLRYESTEVGDLFLFGIGTPTLVAVQESADTVAITTSRIVGDTEVSREGVLAQMRFRATASGLAPLEIVLSAVALVTRAGAPVPDFGLLSVVPVAVVVGGGIVLNPSQGHVETTTLLSASGFTPGEPVRISFGASVPEAPVVADEGGRVFHAAVTIPRAPAGRYSVSATGLTSGATASATFVIVPRIVVLEPRVAGPGDTLRVGGDGFGARERLSFTTGEVVVQDVITGGESDERGDVSAVLVVPVNVVRGPADFRAEGRTSRAAVVARNILTIVPRITGVSPRSGGLGAVVQVSAAGFGPNEALEMLYDRTLVGQVNASPRGTVVTTLTVSANLVSRSEYGAVPIALRSQNAIAASAPFVFTPSPTIASVAPDGGDTNVEPGEFVTVRAVGFPAESPVSATFADVDVNVSGSASVMGEVELRFALPTVPGGPQALVLRSDRVAVTNNTLRMTGRIIRTEMQGGSNRDIGALGTVLFVEGAGFTPNDTITFDLGSLAGLHTTRTGPDGAFTAGIVLRQLPADLPAGVGEVLLRARDRATVAQARVLLSTPSTDVVATARVRLSRTEISDGESFRAIGVGFVGNFRVGRLFFDSEEHLRSSPQQLTIEGVEAGIVTGDGLLADANGAFDVRVRLPSLGEDSRTGPKQVFSEFPKDQTSRPTAFAPIQLRSALRLTTVTGGAAGSVSPGDVLLLHATGLGPSAFVQARLGSSLTSFTDSTDGNGRIPGVAYVVPNVSGGTQMLRLEVQGTELFAEAPLAVLPKLFLLFPGSGALVTKGSTVTVQGAGFPDGPVSFDMGGVPLTATAPVAAVDGFFTAILGGFTGSFPAEARIRASSGTLSATTPETLRFVASELTFSPRQGPSGTVVSVRGAPGNLVKFGDIALGPLRNGTPISNLWEGEFVVPEVEGGVYAVVIGLLAEGVQPPTFSVTPTLTVQPTVAVVGDSVRVEGSNFKGGRNVTVSVGGARPPQVVLSDAAGRFAATLTVPPVPGGQTQVVASDDAFFRSAPLRLDPIIREVAPDAADVGPGGLASGGRFHIVAHGFGPEEEVAVLVGPAVATERRRVLTNAAGTVDASLVLAAAPLGRQNVRIVGKVSGLSATTSDTPLTVRPSLQPPQPATGAVGTSVRVTGAGFAPEEPVRVELGTGMLGETGTDALGTFLLNARITHAEPNGALGLAATGTTSGATAHLDAAFAYRDTQPPAILSVEEDSGGKTLVQGNVLRVTAVQGDDLDVITEATFRVDSLTGTLRDDDGDRVWTGTVEVPPGLNIAARPLEASLRDLAGNTARRSTTTRVTVDTLAVLNRPTATGSPAKAGNKLTVRATGEPGGKALLRVPGVGEPLEMAESPAGTYTTVYTVAQGIVAADVPLVVEFTDRYGNATTAETAPVTIDGLVEVRRIVVEGSPARYGGTLSFTVLTEPKGSVRVRIEGVVDDLILREDAKEPGRYTGTHVVRQREALEEAAVVVRVADRLGNTLEDRALRVSIEASAEIRIPLARGINLVTIPVQDERVAKMRDVLALAGTAARLIVRYDADAARFIACGRDTDPDSPANAPIRPGEGYALYMSAPGVLTVGGVLWREASLRLREGVNLVGLTRNDPGAQRMSDLAQRLGDAFLEGVSYDAQGGAFRVFLPGMAPERPENRALRVGEAYILTLGAAAELRLTGTLP
jgi:hypothetical protein